jgi:methionine-rich copper-binding protein CopC
VKRWMLVAVIICGAALFGAAPASAHSELVSSDPPADVTLEFAPIGVGLVFNQDINESFATISLIGPDEEQWAQGSATVEGPNVSVLIKDGLPNGQYTVGYRVTSADGHPITGSYDFMLEVAVTTAASEPSNGAVPPGSASGTAPSALATTTAPAYDPNNPSASEDRPPKQNTMMLLSIVGIAVLGLAAIALTLVIRGKNKQ